MPFVCSQILQNQLQLQGQQPSVKLASFEEQFKTKSQMDPVDVGTLKMKLVHKTPSKVSLIEPNRAKNLAITLRKEGLAATSTNICSTIETYINVKKIRK